MSDYIRRQDVLKGQKTGMFANGICFEGKRCVPVEYIESLESADVVQVCRCRDCKYFYEDIGICDNTDALVSPTADGFCSYGEREE